MWVNLRGEDLAANPHIHRPSVLPRHKVGWFLRDANDSYIDYSKFQWDDGGIYNQEQLENLNEFTQSMPQQAEVLQTFTDTMRGTMPEEYEGAVFGINTFMNALGVSEAWEGILWFLYSYSQVCSSFMAFYITIKLIGWTIGLSHRKRIINQQLPDKSWCSFSKLAPLLFPSLMTQFAVPPPSSTPIVARFKKFPFRRSHSAPGSGRRNHSTSGSSDDALLVDASAPAYTPNPQRGAINPSPFHALQASPDYYYRG